MTNMKQLPHDIELEKAILGALLLEPFASYEIAPILREEFFYSDANKYVYRAIKTLLDSNSPVDILTVTKEVKKMGRLEEVGGAYYISTLTNRIATSANIESHTRVIHQFYILRELYVLGNELSARSLIPSADCFDLINKINSRIGELTTFVTSNTKTVGEVFETLVSNIRNVIENGIKTGLESGIENIDRITGGWQKGNLIVIAARPGMGKTAAVLKFASHASISLKRPVLMFSMEMTALELVGRVASSESWMSSTKIGQNTLTMGELNDLEKGCVKLKDAPFFIDDTPALSVSDLKARAKKMHHEHGIDLIIVDYLQLMNGDGKGNREQEISQISRGLKALAKDLDVPVIALSQLSRKVEERPDKRPMLSDLRESGAIEQDADIVAFLFRPYVYGLFENEPYMYGGQSLDDVKHLMIFDVAKGRGINIQEVPMKFFGENMVVTNYNLHGQEDPIKGIDNNYDFLNPQK